MSTEDNGFWLTEEQLAKINKWMSPKPVVYGGAIGGRFTYSFTPTTIGVIIKVKDNNTGEEIDVSDYEGF